MAGKEDTNNLLWCSPIKRLLFNAEFAMREKQWIDRRSLSRIALDDQSRDNPITHKIKMPTDNAPTPVHEAGSGGGPPPPAALGAQPAGAVLKHKGDDVHQSYTDHTPRMKKPKVKESIIDHTYRDYSMVQVSDDEDEAISATSDEKKHTRLQPNFPAKLHAIVSNPKYDHIIAWQVSYLHDVSRYFSRRIPLIIILIAFIPTW